VLILVRHGRTAGNAQGLLQGRLDLPLDDVGRLQARHVGWALSDADRVISSPLGRARETAARIGKPVDIDERWMELDYGSYDGQPLAAISAADWSRWRGDPHFSVGGGESLAQLLDRLRPALEELCESARTETVVVVSHVTPIKVAIAWALHVGVELSWRTQLDHASISRLAMGARGPVLQSFNETAHLAALAAPEHLP
jgi:broad specificity phosphatase PhoE